MEDCVFCKIVKNELPAYKIYEDSEFLAFLDIEPCCDSHTLLIPKKHYRWVWDYPNIGQYFKAAQKIIKHFRQVTSDEFVAGVVWGKDVPHAHLQILPAAHHLNFHHWPKKNLTKNKAKTLLQKFALK